MNHIAPTNPSATMTSREIAELTGKEHFHVMRDVVSMLQELGVTQEGYIQNWIHPQNHQTYQEFSLPKDLTITLVSGYSVAMRHRIVTRWQELEQQAAAGFNPSSLSRMDILQMAMESEEGRLKAEAQLAIAAPKAEALDRISLSDGSMCVTNAAKVLGVQPKKLFAWLQSEQWIYRRAGGSGLWAIRTVCRSAT